MKLEIGSLVPTRTQLPLPDHLTFEEWEDIGRTLDAVEAASQWWRGDWLNYGERAYGEKYAQAVEVTGASYGTLANAAWVSGAVEVSRRRESLSWSHHYEVAALDHDIQDQLLDEAESNGWNRNTLRDAVRHYKVALENPGAAATTLTVEDLAAIEGRQFGTVYADPPWLYGNQATRAATSNHYEGMTVAEIAALPIAGLVDDVAHCHLWTTNAFLFDGRDVLEAWGFEYKSTFVWAKTQMGIGNYWRVSHEFMLLGVRGSAPFAHRGQMSWREWPRSQHSTKPYQMYDIIESVSPGPYLELFARQQREGWVSWGNEVERDLFYKDTA